MSNNNENLLDEGLQAVMGPDRCKANWQPSGTGIPVAKYPEENSAEKKPTTKWQPVKPDPDDITRVKNATKWSALFGGLCLLFFYWQQTGLMDPTAAVPSMLTCMLCAGVSVGKNLTK